MAVAHHDLLSLDGPVPALIRRMRNLAALELVNIPLWAVVFFGVFDFPLTAANLTGFGAFALLLLEGSGYWILKIRQLRSRASQLPGVKVFRVLRLVNVALLAAALAVVIAATVSSPGGNSLPGLFLALFGVAEHINYFHVQLMHDTKADLRRLVTVGLRRSQLARDLQRSPASS